MLILSSDNPCKSDDNFSTIRMPEDEVTYFKSAIRLSDNLQPWTSIYSIGALIDKLSCALSLRTSSRIDKRLSDSLTLTSSK